MTTTDIRSFCIALTKVYLVIDLNNSLSFDSFWRHLTMALHISGIFVFIKRSHTQISTFIYALGHIKHSFVIFSSYFIVCLVMDLNKSFSISLSPSSLRPFISQTYLHLQENHAQVISFMYTLGHISSSFDAFPPYPEAINHSLSIYFCPPSLLPFISHVFHPLRAVTLKLPLIHSLF